MYHDTIHIQFDYNSVNDINFTYSFLISQGAATSWPKEKFSPIEYTELLNKFEEIGFNLRYLKFNDIYNFDTTVYCSYNYQPNFNIFFSAYKKLIQHKNFNIFFEYGNIINGKFLANNMNFFAGVSFFTDMTSFGRIGIIEPVIKGKVFQKMDELYQIIDKDGNIIHKELAKAENDFEQHFFEKYDVKVALRKYKLSRLKAKFAEN